jgi:putative addiction module component (TIGR02574 family)
MSSEFSRLMTLDVPQKLELIGALWDSLEGAQDRMPVSDELIAELDRRKAAAELNPESLVPWEKVKERLGIHHGK